MYFIDLFFSKKISCDVVAIKIEDSKTQNKMEVCALYRGKAYNENLKTSPRSLIDMTKTNCDSKKESYLNTDSSEYSSKALLFSLTEQNICDLNLFNHVELSNASYVITNANFTIVTHFY